MGYEPIYDLEREQKGAATVPTIRSAIYFYSNDSIETLASLFLPDIVQIFYSWF